MFDRFTSQAWNVVELARDEARARGRDHVGTGHILLALLHPGTGTPGEALESLGITLEAARKRAGQVTGLGQQAQPSEIPFTPRAEKALELSLREALQLGDNYIGGGHVLLGLLRLGEGSAAQILNDLGAEPGMVRHRVIELMSAGMVEPGIGVRLVTAGGEKRKLAAGRPHRLDSVEQRLSALEQGGCTDMRDLDSEIVQVRRDKDAAIDARDFESAAALRETEQQLIASRAARQRGQAALPALSEEIERLRGLLRRHGISPQEGEA